MIREWMGSGALDSLIYLTGEGKTRCCKQLRGALSSAFSSSSFANPGALRPRLTGHLPPQGARQLTDLMREEIHRLLQETAAAGEVARSLILSTLPDRTTDLLNRCPE